MLLSNYVAFIFFLFIRSFCIYVLIGLLFLIAGDLRKMPGGRIQRSVARVYRRMMPHSDAGEGSDRSSGVGRGKGRGKGGPKRGRGKSGGRRLREPSPVPPSKEEEEEEVEPAQDQEREEEWQADAQEEGGVV